jgi:hypothetical protein
MVDMKECQADLSAHIDAVKVFGPVSNDARPGQSKDRGWG